MDAVNRALKKMAPEIRRCIEAAQEQGWTLDMTSKSHWRLRPPPGALSWRGDGSLQPPVTFALTASDKRSHLNSAAELKRAGVRW